VEGLPFALTLASMIATTWACDSSFGDICPANAAAALAAVAALQTDIVTLTGEPDQVFNVSLEVFEPANTAAALAAIAAALTDAATLDEEADQVFEVSLEVFDLANTAAALAVIAAALTDAATLDEEADQVGEIVVAVFDPTNASALADADVAFAAFLRASSAAVFSASVAAALSVSKIPIVYPQVKKPVWLVR